MTDYNKYKKLELEDKYNRHLIVGDIHGQFDLLWQLLQNIDYNAETDMLYTVGDMIDRGNKSYEVVSFFTSHKNRFSTLGNHEAMVINKDWTCWDYNGGRQTKTSLHNNNVDSIWLHEKVKSLPLVLDVECGKLEFRIVHAEFNRNYDDYDIMSRLTGSVTDYTFEGTCLWGRSNIVHKFTSKSKIPTYVGHTIVREPTQLGNVSYLNVPLGELVMLDVKSGELYSV